MEKLLSEINENQTVTIIKLLETNSAVFARLQEYGLVEGEKVRIIKIAPKSEVYLISVRGFALCIDKETCNKVIVK